MKADVCLILEGSYPYVLGGVGNWTDQYIRSHSERTFHLLTILPPDHKHTLHYQLPENVVGITHLELQKLPKRMEKGSEPFKKAVLNFFEQGDLHSFKTLLQQSFSCPSLDSEFSWDLLQQIYRRVAPETSFLSFFWAWQALLANLYSILLTDLPEADLYHSLCTGYAGLMLARARLEKNKPCFLTEHGIYACEREIEIVRSEEPLYLTKIYKNYSQVCYGAASQIITLYEENRQIQLSHGADPEKTLIIPNGVDYDLYASVEKESGRPPTVAFIGRVVPVKEVKIFIRAIAILAKHIPNLKAYVVGPTDENEPYYHECIQLVQDMCLTKTLVFSGKVDVLKFLKKIDVLTLTSDSEAQPLVILEAGAAGIPCVVTDVGACREMIGDGGVACPRRDPAAIAAALERLFVDAPFYQQCSQKIKQRVRTRFQLSKQNTAYNKVYQKWQESDLPYANC